MESENGSGSGIVTHPDYAKQIDDADNTDNDAEQLEELEFRPKKNRKVHTYVLVKCIEEINVEEIDKEIREDDFTPLSRWSKSSTKLLGRTLLYDCWFSSSRKTSTP